MARQKLTLDQLAQRLEQMASVQGVRAGIGTEDAESAAILRALEFGSISGEKPWPHAGPQTVLAVDQETGAQVVVSAKSPHGFLRSLAPEIMDRLRGAVVQPANWFEPEEAQGHLRESLRTVAAEALAQARAAIPSSSQKIRNNLVLIHE